MKGKLWSFSGLDGAGKTTQIEMLMDRVTREGQSVRRVWARGGYTPLFEFAKRLLRRTSSSALPAAGRSKERSQRFRRPTVRKLWLLIAILDLTLYWGIWVRWLQLNGRIVVADRWIMDTELDFELNFPEENVARWISWRFVKLLMPRPTEHFIFVIPVKESQRRSAQKNEPFPDSTEVLKMRFDYYKNAVEEGKGIEIDGMLSREEVHAIYFDSCCHEVAF